MGSVSRFLLALTLVAGAAFFVFDIPFMTFEHYMGEGQLFLSAVIFAAALILSTVIAPIAALPLMPIAAHILGPTLAGAIAVISWTIGGTIAFLLARYGGRPILSRIVDMRKLERFELNLGSRNRFLFLVMLRMTIPVDLLSYALGFLSSVTIREFVLTTVLGVSWFAFAFAYLGDALIRSDYVLLGGLGVASGIILFVALRFVRIAQKNDR